MFILLRSTPIVTRVCAISWRQAGDDDASPHQPGGVNHPDEVIRRCLVDVWISGDVDDHHLGAMGADTRQQLLGELTRTLGVQHR